MSSKWVIGAMSLVLVSGAANAKEQLEAEHKAGMFTGAAMGAVVGGPVGAVFGLVVGAMGGDFLSGKRIAEQHAQALEKEKQDLELQLQETQEALAQLSTQTSVEPDPLLSSLAERLHGEVLFHTGSAEVEAAMQERLAELGAILAQQPLVMIEVEGFTDPRGSKDANLALSEARAVAVREALLKGGLAGDRVHVSAHGESKSTAPLGDSEAYAWERRVSVAIRTSQVGQLAKR
jgi:outer membrane protein OmpA-like peptidoglycan-associated protein